MTTDSTELSAYHEAGHALMAFLAGASVDSVTIDPDWDDAPERYGDTRIGWPVGKFPEKILHEKMILVALAGPVAEMIHTANPYHPGMVGEWANDWHLAKESVEMLIEEERKQVQYLEQKTIELYRLFNQERYWATLAALVDHLLAHETMEREEVEDVFQAWL